MLCAMCCIMVAPSYSLRAGTCARKVQAQQLQSISLVRCVRRTYRSVPHTGKRHSAMRSRPTLHQTSLPRLVLIRASSLSLCLYAILVNDARLVQQACNNQRLDTVHAWRCWSGHIVQRAQPMPGRLSLQGSVRPSMRAPSYR